MEGAQDGPTMYDGIPRQIYNLGTSLARELLDPLAFPPPPSASPPGESATESFGLRSGSSQSSSERRDCPPPLESADSASRKPAGSADADSRGLGACSSVEASGTHISSSALYTPAA